MTFASPEWLIGGGIVVVALLAAIVVAGLAGSFGLSRFIASLLFATSPFDAQTLAGVSVLFVLVALAACFLPAWRAAQADPMTALRQE